jgi:hypothetical protein
MRTDHRDTRLLERSIDWPEVQGKVISNVQVLIHAEVEYDYTVSSKRYTGVYKILLYKQSRFNSPAESANEIAECLASFPPGSNVVIRYNPRRPAESVIYRRGEID